MVGYLRLRESDLRKVKFPVLRKTGFMWVLEERARRYKFKTWGGEGRSEANKTWFR